MTNNTQDRFKVRIHGLPYQEEFKSMITDLKTNFCAKEGNVVGEILLLNDEFELFLNRYLGNKKIDWNWLCEDSNTPWNEQILTKTNYYWDWKFIIHHPSIKWNDELIYRNAKYIDFDYFYENVTFDWNIETINKLKLWINFNILSRSEKINWSNKIIIEFKDNWDWHLLSLNEKIKWTNELISESKDFIDFELLCFNENVEWSNELLEKYNERLNWHFLSGNSQLPWSTEFIIKNESKLLFGDKEIKEYDKNYLYQSIEKRKYIDRYRIKSLSKNKSIIWNLQLFDRYIDRLDVWDISLNGKIEKEVLVKYHEKFDEKRFTGCFYYKYSDWDDNFEVFTNCWQNLIINPNMDTEMIEDEIFTRKTFEYSTPHGNLARDGIFIKKIVSIDELFKNGYYQIINRVGFVSC